MFDSRAVPPPPSVTPRRSMTRRRALLVATGAVAGLLGVVAPAAPLAAQDFTVGSTEVHTSTVYDALDLYSSDGVTLCKDVLDQMNMASPDSETNVEITNEEGVRVSRRTQTWTRGDPNTAAGECKFVIVSDQIYTEVATDVYLFLFASSTLTITFSKVMPAANTANYDFVDADGNVIGGNFEVPEGNCVDDYPATGSTRFDNYDPNTETEHLQIRPGDLYGVRLNSRPDSTVWITSLQGTEAAADLDLWTPSSTTWTISPTDYDLGRTTRWIRVCAFPDDDSDNGTRNFHHLLNSNDADFLGTTDPLVVQEVDDD